MQVFTRCFNYCNRSWLWTASKTRGVRSHDAIPHGKQKQRPNTKKQHKQTKTGKPANKTKNTKTKQPTQPGRGKSITTLLVRRSDQAAYVPRPEQVIHRSNRRTKPSKSPDEPTGAKQKSRNAETRDPPSQDPKRGRAGMTSTNAHRSHRYAGRVKRWGWNDSETIVRHTEWRNHSASARLSESSKQDSLCKAIEMTT